MASCSTIALNEKIAACRWHNASWTRRRWWYRSTHFVNAIVLLGALGVQKIYRTIVYIRKKNYRSACNKQPRIESECYSLESLFRHDAELTSDNYFIAKAPCFYTLTPGERISQAMPYSKWRTHGNGMHQLKTLSWNPCNCILISCLSIRFAVQPGQRSWRCRWEIEYSCKHSQVGKIAKRRQLCVIFSRSQ